MLDLETIRRVVCDVARANGARLAVLFGSWARGTADERSDVDVVFVEETQGCYLDRLGRYFKPLLNRLNAMCEPFIYTPAECSNG